MMTPLLKNSRALALTASIPAIACETSFDW
jgi:hypothetical protein